MMPENETLRGLRERNAQLEQQVRNLIQAVDLCVGGSVFKRVTDEAKKVLGESDDA